MSRTDLATEISNLATARQSRLDATDWGQIAFEVYEGAVVEIYFEASEKLRRARPPRPASLSSRISRVVESNRTAINRMEYGQVIFKVADGTLDDVVLAASHKLSRTPVLRLLELREPS
jgi:hypothetical protein